MRIEVVIPAEFVIFSRVRFCELANKRMIGLGTLLLVSAVVRAQPIDPRSLSGEAICGYAGSLRQFSAGAVQQGISVTMLAGDVEAGATVPLRFRVTRQPQAEPVDDLQVEHEKLMHVIGVRDDLREFLHIHPQRVAPGLWQVNHTFTNAGRYQLWTDIKQRGTVYSFKQPLLKVTGNAAAHDYEKVPRLEDRAGGFQVNLTAPGALVAGRTNLFLVTIRNQEGTQIGAEFFLGALMHIVVIKDDLMVYAHGHAKNHLKGERDISFNQIFPQPGNYKIFTQFRPLKTKLPPEEAIRAEFWVKVRKAD